MPVHAQVGKAAASADTIGVPRVILGAVIGAAFWYAVSTLGFPQIFGLGTLSLLPLAIAVGSVAGITRFARSFAYMTAALLLLLLVVAFTPVMKGPGDRLIRRDIPPPRADAIVVLSAGVTMDGMLPQQGMDRLIKGVELARAGVAPRIVVTREEKTWGGRVITSDADQQRILAFAETPAMITGRVTSTREEALRVKAIAERQGWHRIVLVTSPFHSRRACATFEKAGLVVSCIPADSRDLAVNNLEGTENRVRAFALWIYELAGTIRYRSAGWI